MNRRNRDFFRGNADGQRAREKVVNAANHQGNENQNCSELPPHTCQNVPSTKRTQITRVHEDLVKREASCTVWGSANGTAPVENSMEASQQTQNRSSL